MGVREFIKIRTIIRQDNFGGTFKMRPVRKGFTTIELLTVIAIIAILVGILVPTVTYVRNSASVAKQKVQMAAIGMALDAFKGDYGDYPPSTLNTSLGAGNYYCGANMLCEALVGWDLLGFEPNSNWDGSYLPYQNCTTPPCDLQGRLGPYLELGTASAFTLGQLFPNVTQGQTNLPLTTYVLCDSFGAKSVTVGGKTVKAGRPILYYKANVASKDFTAPADATAAAAASKIYNYTDNIDLLNLKKNSEKSADPLAVENDSWVPSSPAGTFFYSTLYKLVDQKVLGGAYIKWPCRPDSYILISAGADGLYGTDDDITNF
jgi:prepilin-type N-terminal cleavage/methylation domain-containing protein